MRALQGESDTSLRLTATGHRIGRSAIRQNEKAGQSSGAGLLLKRASWNTVFAGAGSGAELDPISEKIATTAIASR